MFLDFNIGKKDDMTSTMWIEYAWIIWMGALHANRRPSLQFQENHSIVGNHAIWNRHIQPTIYNRRMDSHLIVDKQSKQ
jgi:hypothetical protein